MPEPTLPLDLEHRCYRQMFQKERATWRTWGPNTTEGRWVMPDPVPEDKCGACCYLRGHRDGERAGYQRGARDLARADAEQAAGEIR